MQVVDSFVLKNSMKLKKKYTQKKLTYNKIVLREWRKEKYVPLQYTAE